MTEIRTNHWTDNSIQSAAMRNNAERAQVAEIAEALMFLIHGKTASAGAAGVMGGFELSPVIGQMQLSVAPGWGWYYDTGIAAPASPFAAFKLDSAQTVNVSTADATFARYDLVSIKCISETDTELSVPFWQAAPQNINTQRGSHPTLTVTAGTPGAFPSIPSTPAGHLALGAVRVGAAVTNLDSATLIDLRDLMSLTTRASTRALRFRSVPNASVIDAAEFILAEILAAGVADGSGSKLKWDRTNDWPVIRRTLATTGENAAQDLFPMMVPGGRTWWRTLPWASTPSVSSSSTPGDHIDVVREALTGRLKLVVQNDAAWGEIIHLPITCEIRGLELVGAQVRYQAAQAMNATVNQSNITLQVAKADGTYVLLATHAVDVSAVDASPVTEAITLSSTPVLDEGDYLVATYMLDHQGDDTGQSDIYLDTLLLQFREGRTS